MVPARSLFPDPRLTLDQLVLVETLGIGWHAVARARPESDDAVLVLGAGPIGLAVAQAARHRVERLLVADISAERVAFAAASGLDALLVDEATSPPVLRDRGRGDLPTVVFDATGQPDVDGGGVRPDRSGRHGSSSSATPRRRCASTTPFHARELRSAGFPERDRRRTGRGHAAPCDRGPLDAIGWINHRTTLRLIVDDLPRRSPARDAVVKRSSTSATRAAG